MLDHYTGNYMLSISIILLEEIEENVTNFIIYRGYFPSQIALSSFLEQGEGEDLWLIKPA